MWRMGDCSLREWLFAAQQLGGIVKQHITLPLQV